MQSKLEEKFALGSPSEMTNTVHFNLQPNAATVQLKGSFRGNTLFHHCSRPLWRRKHVPRTITVVKGPSHCARVCRPLPSPHCPLCSLGKLLAYGHPKRQLSFTQNSKLGGSSPTMKRSTYNFQKCKFWELFES